MELCIKKWSISAVLVIIVLLIAQGSSRTTDDEYNKEERLAVELTPDFWREDAYRYIRTKVQVEAGHNINTAKNIILFLGDGMSLQTVAAARMFMGGEELNLSFEDFPHFGLSKTYSVDYQVSDSANTATAYLSGVKANYGTIGVNGHVKRNDCLDTADTTMNTASLAKWAQEQCKATGLVTTARVTHASPAGVYAHTPNRDWENNQEVLRNKCDPTRVSDIAMQLVQDDVARKLNVVLGGGRREFRNSTMLDEEGNAGYRSDGRDLIAEWQQDRSSRGNASYIWNKWQLSDLDYNNTDFLLGMFAHGHCPYHEDIDRLGLEDTVPTLTEMTLAAIRLLSQDPDGYFLFVESARIDHAHHDTYAQLALEETRQFSNLIDIVRSMTNQSDTLLVVTADHSHVMTYNGNSKRGNPILGLSESVGSDNLPFSTLSYANGNGYYNTYNATGARFNLTTTNFSDPYLRYMSMVPMDDETHGGDDVGVYASGPWSHLFTGNYEQNNIPVAMAYSAKIGPYAEKERTCGGAANFAVATSAMAVGLLILF